jgi:hypothetical protein
VKTAGLPDKTGSQATTYTGPADDGGGVRSVR